MTEISSQTAFEDIAVGDTVAEARFPIARMNLVMYAGASGDFNPIHWNERIATMVGLPNVIAHGMLTMAEAGRLLTDLAGDPGRVIDYGVRFTRPVVVADDDAGTTVVVAGTVSAVDPDARTITVDLSATVDGESVLGNASGRIAYPSLG